MTKMFTRFLLCVMLAVSAPALAQQGAQAQQQTAPADTSKLRFFAKIGHWLAAYNMSGPDFVHQPRTTFKSSAFAEVYIDATINIDVWMFNMLNRVSAARYPALERQEPNITVRLILTPKDDQLNEYTVGMAFTASKAVKADLVKIGTDVSNKYLTGKKYVDPAEAIEDIEPAITEALTTLAPAIGSDLAPNLMVRYNGEIFWSGHTINVLAAEGDYAELEAIGKDGQPLASNEISWTNAEHSGSRGIVDLTGVATKTVSLRSGDDALSVTLKRVNIGVDINELLKRLIIEVLSTKKSEAVDTLAKLKTDSVANAGRIKDYIAHLERGNFPMEPGGTLTPMFANPIIRPDSAVFLRDPDMERSFRELKHKKRVRNAIRRKVNVVAFADLVVDHPDRMKDLLDELLRSSGRLVARLILNTDSKGQADEARDIVIEFLNNNLERIAGNYYPPSLSIEPPLVIPPAPNPPQFDPNKFLYVSPQANFEGKADLIERLNAYLVTLDTPLYVFINYSHDATIESYLARAPGATPRGIPEGARYKVFTVVNMPGSVMENVIGGGETSTATTAGKGIEEIVLRDKEFREFQEQFREEFGIYDFGVCGTKAWIRKIRTGEKYGIEDWGWYAAAIEYVLCITEKERCKEDPYKCGVVNAIAQELDWIALLDAVTEFSITEKDIEKFAVCIVEKMPRGTYPGAPTFEDVFFRCLVGISPGDLQAALKQFVAENWNDPYTQGQATVFAITMISPFKAGAIKKLEKLTGWARDISKFRSLSKATKSDELIALSKQVTKGVTKVLDDIALKNLKPELPSGAYINPTKFEKALKIDPPANSRLKQLVDDVTANGDVDVPGGSKTEDIQNILFRDAGYDPLDGKVGRGSGQGLDGLYIKGNVKNPTEIIIGEAKQWQKSGGVALSPANPATNLPLQMSRNWVDNVANRIVDEANKILDPKLKQDRLDIAAMLLDPINRPKIQRYITVVDKTKGQVNILKLGSY